MNATTTTDTHDAIVTKCKSLLSRASFFAHLSKENPSKEQFFWKTACDFVNRASICGASCLSSLNNFERKMISTGIPLVIPISFFDNNDSVITPDQALSELDDTLHETDDHDRYVTAKRIERELIECRRELSAAKSTITSLTEHKERYEQRIAELVEKVATLQREKEGLCAQLSERNDEINDVIDRKLSILKDKLSRYMSENTRLHEELVAAGHYEEQVRTLEEERRVGATMTARKISSYENRLVEYQEELESLQHETQIYKDLLYKLGPTLTDEQSAIIVGEMEKNGGGGGEDEK